MADEGRKILGAGLPFEERLALAQLTTQPGWPILVRLMAEACRKATEEVIKLDPGGDRYDQRLAGTQTTARAMNKFSADVLDSVKVHRDTAVLQAQQQENVNLVEEPKPRFQMPLVKSPIEGQQQESNKETT